MRVLAIILARKGSRRCPGKNVMVFDLERRRNIVELCLEQAQSLVNEVVVSSDYAPEQLFPHFYAEGEFPYFHFHERPPELAQDDTSSEAVVEVLLDKYRPTEFVLLQPTSPVRTIGTLRKAKALFEGHPDQFPALVSVNPAGKPNGAFYFCRTKTFREHGSWWSPDAVMYEMSWEESVDVDTLPDFRIAQALYEGRWLLEGRRADGRT